MATIGMVVHNQENIGTYHRALTFARILSESHDVELFAFGRELWKGEQREEGRLRVHLAPSYLQRPYYVGLNDWLPRTLAARKTDIWWCFEHLPSTFIPTFLRRSVFGKKRIISDWCDLYSGGINSWHHLALLQKIEKYFEENVRRLADVNTCISHPLYERLLHLGCPSERVLIAPEITDVQRIQPIETALARRTLHVAPDETVVFCFMEEALHHLSREALTPPPGARLVIAGKGSERFEGEGVQGLGYAPEELLHRWMSATDAFFLPLENIAANVYRLPHKLSHYLCYGKPLIYSPVGDVARLQAHNIGLEFHVASQALHEVVCELRELDAGTKQDMGQRARALAEKEFGVGTLRSVLHRAVELSS